MSVLEFTNMILLYILVNSHSSVLVVTEMTEVSTDVEKEVCDVYVDSFWHELSVSLHLNHHHFHLNFHRTHAFYEKYSIL